MPLYTRLHRSEALGIAGGFTLLAADVDVHQRGASFVGLVRGFDLLADADGHRGVVGLLRYRPGDGNADDTERCRRHFRPRPAARRLWFFALRCVWCTR